MECDYIQIEKNINILQGMLEKNYSFGVEEIVERLDDHYRLKESLFLVNRNLKIKKIINRI